MKQLPVLLSAVHESLSAAADTSGVVVNDGWHPHHRTLMLLNQLGYVFAVTSADGVSFPVQYIATMEGRDLLAEIYYEVAND